MSSDSSNYEFDAPRYVDFKNSNLDENDGADRFFDINMKLQDLKMEPDDHENETSVKPSTHMNFDGHAIVKQEKITPNVQTVKHPNALKEVSANVMKSKDGPNLKKRFGSPLPGHPQKFISLAESVLLFAKKTPQRFHTKSKNQVFIKPAPVERPNATQPQSPTLVSGTRTRKVEYPTREEQEEKLVQEMKNYHIKANPVKENVLHPPQLGRRVEKKPPTKVEPFQLTEYVKKELPEEPLFKFSANAVPKGLFKHPLGLPDKKVIPPTVPKTPQITKLKKMKVPVLQERDGENFAVNVETSHWGVSPSQWKPGQTTVKPFTFEERDKIMLKRKEEKIQQILKQEKEAREFRAQPLPKFIKKTTEVSCLSGGSTFDVIHSPNSSSSKDQSEANNSGNFKARPAVVLRKEPFVPKKPERPALSTEEVILHTEKRAEERKAFDAHIHEKEEELRRYLQMVQEEEERREAEEIARLRKATVLKANPMPSFESTQLSIPKKSPTVPISPKFSDRFKK
ncbi:targeting protein for Xklp2 [Anabrus simplex]|uniref:targeting protein for Xklp2 n=1 Tax=Anabrus simplex TaxID=316456 RepID=UPI0035A3709F